MNGRGGLKILCGVLVACSGLIHADAAFADVQDSRFDVSRDGASVDFDVQDTTRRDVLSRLFAGTGIEITWLNAPFADERISGKFSGPASSVARQLLARTNFVLVHDHGDEASRVIRVVVVGPATGERSPAALAALAAALPSSRAKDAPPAGSAAVVARPHGPTSWSSLGQGGPLKPPPPGAAPLPVVPPGVEAPRLIPPSADAVLPLIPPSRGAAAPALIPVQPDGVDNK